MSDLDEVVKAGYENPELFDDFDEVDSIEVDLGDDVPDPANEQLEVGDE